MAEPGGLSKGLEGVVAAESDLCDVDGVGGRLAYRGYDIADLAGEASYEEVLHLLWHGELPALPQLEALQGELVTARALPEALLSAYHLLPKEVDPMRALQLSVAMLGMIDPDGGDNSRPANRRKAARLTAQLATAVSAHHRVRSGKAPVRPAEDLAHAANFLYMLTGERPSEVASRALDASLVLYAEHELNASTFTARVVASTLSDMHSAVAGGIGALRGPLHGGAGEAVMRTLQEIGRPEEVGPLVERSLVARRRLMGFGHRVYRAGDPRAAILRGLAAEACRASDQGIWYEMAVRLHERVQAAKGLLPNVDFYSAPLFYALGIPVDLFTSVIAASRIAGWSSHVLEQHEDNRLIRPRALYRGPGRRPYVPLAAR